MFIWGWVWTWFGVFIINKIALAQVEEGYLINKFENRFDWLTKRIQDPLINADYKRVERKSLTMPEALKNYNLLKMY